MSDMNDVLKAIKERNSCRDFYPEALTEEQVKNLVDAALAAPSAVNRMPWHIIVVTDKALIEEMDAAAMDEIAGYENKDFYNRMKDRGGKIFYDAPFMMFVLKDESDWGTLDSGIVIQNVALAAHSMGLGNVICGMARIPLDGAKGAEFKKRLQFPENHSFAISICVGKAKSGKEPHEFDMSKVTYVK